MKHILFLAAMLFSAASFAQTSDYDISKDDETGAVVFKGQISFSDLQKEPTFDWMKKGAASYKPSKEDIKYLKQYMPAYDLVILMGTWCDDSQHLIPDLYKVLTAAGYPANKVNMFGVDRAKETKNIEHKLYRLEKVPTIIVFKNHSEISRIVEHVNKSIESDLVEIISNDMENAPDAKK